MTREGIVNFNATMNTITKDLQDVSVNATLEILLMENPNYAFYIEIIEKEIFQLKLLCEVLKNEND